MENDLGYLNDNYTDEGSFNRSHPRGSSLTDRDQNSRDTNYIYNDIVQKTKSKTLNDSFTEFDAIGTDIFRNEAKTDKLSQFNEGFDVRDAYTELSDGTLITRYDDFLQGTDNEERYANSQSTSEKWVNGIQKYGLKTATNVAGGTLGTVWGVISAISEGNLERVYDNSFYDMLDDMTAREDNFLANYRTQEERDMGILEKANPFGTGFSNFVADEFLGGLSFMTGTVISEALWATATGGASLTTTMARAGLRAGKYFGTGAKFLTKGLKSAAKHQRKYEKAQRVFEATQKATRWGKGGEIANLLRFTYTGAGFEAGMEARLYQREQRDNFYRDFETLNGKPPESEDIAEFEKGLDMTTNSLWWTNMALVGTSNFAVLGKTFGITSPFKGSSKKLDKVLFGKGTKDVLGKAGERVKTEAIKRNTLQKGLGLAKGVLKNPFYEGVVEEGGQATASTAMESYLTSRYNPSKDAMGIVESMYEASAHTYGTKEGWNEVGLGMLIGLIGGEISNALSRQGVLTEARDAVQDSHGKEIKNSKGEIVGGTGSIGEAYSKNQNLGTKLVDRVTVNKLEEALKHATEVQNSTEALQKAEEKGDAMGMANAQSRLMLTSVKHANDFGYLEEQVEDFRTALTMRAQAEEGQKSELAEHYDIDQSEVGEKIDTLVSEYENLGNKYKKAKEFADYIVSDNPKELFEDATDVNVHEARQAIAYQMVMAEVSEQNMNGAHDALLVQIADLSPTLAGQFTKALSDYHSLRTSKKEVVKKKRIVESKLKNKRVKLEELKNALTKIQERAIVEDKKKDKSNSDKANSITNKITELEQEISGLTVEKAEINSQMNSTRGDLLNNKTTRHKVQRAAAELDAIDPLLDSDTVDSNTLEETQSILEQLDRTLEESNNPILVAKIKRLTQEYKKGLDIWERNAKTVSDLADPKLGLNRVGTMIQKKKTAGKTTLGFLKRLKQTQEEEREFAEGVEKALIDKNKTAELQKTNQQKADEDIGENPGEVQENLENLTEDEISGTEYASFVNKGVVSEKRIKNIAIKIKNRENLSEKEKAIFSDKTKEVNEELINIQNNSTKTPLQTRLAELKQDLRDLVGKNSLLLENFSEDKETLLDDNKPTQEDLDRYQELKDKFKSGDIGLLVGRPFEQIGKRTKERSGLTDTEIQEYQDLARKMLDWRIITSTNENGLSVQDILNEIEAYGQEVVKDETQPSKEQFLEMTQDAENEFSVGRTDSDIGQTMSYVNIARKDDRTEVSHLDLKTFEEEGFTVSAPTEINVGTEENPLIHQVYRISKSGEDTFEVVKVKNSNNRLLVEDTKLDKFLKALGLTKINYNLKTAWGFIFKNGKLMKSDFGIESTNGEKLHPSQIYELEPGSKLNFYIDTEDSYNIRDIIPLIKEGKIEEAKAKMAIYIKTEKGKTVVLLKAGQGEKGSNFDKIRQGAIEMFQDKLDRGFTEEDLLKDSNLTQFQLPFQTTVEKVFIGTPNLKLDENNEPIAYSIPEKAIKDIVGYGYAEQGKLSTEDEDVRMTFIPKNKNTPYVIIKQGNTKIAFPVGLNPSSEFIKQEIIDAVSDDRPQQEQILDVVNILKRNGIEPANFNLKILGEDNKLELNKILKAVETSKKRYSKKDVLKMSKEEFISNTEILIDLNEEAFVSPKIKMNISKELINIDTKEKTTDNPVPQDRKTKLILNNQEILAQANTKEELVYAVINTGDSELKKLFNEDAGFRKQVEDFSLSKKVVPKIMTQKSAEELLQDIIDLESEDVPLNLQEEFKKEVEDIKNNATKEKIKALAKKIIKAAKDQFKVVQSSIDTNHLYHISTEETVEEMLEQGFVRTQGDFYKKVKYTDQEDIRIVLEGLYNKHKTSFLPSHMNIKEGVSLEEFMKVMPKTLLGVYQKYYNTQPKKLLSKKAVITGNEQYLKEEFKGDFVALIDKERKRGSKLYGEVLKHFDAEGVNITVDPLFSRKELDKYKKELGPVYNALIEYSLINKHIDLHEQPENIIFAELEISDFTLNTRYSENIEEAERLKAVNNPNLKEAKGVMLNFNDDGSITLGKGNADFVRYNNEVYEKTQDLGNGEYDYYPIAKVDDNFLITEVKTPFATSDNFIDKEIDTTKTNINRTEGSLTDCK